MCPRAILERPVRITFHLEVLVPMPISRPLDHTRGGGRGDPIQLIPEPHAWHTV